MAIASAGSPSQADLRRDLLYLGRGRLLFFIVSCFTFGWSWFPYVMFRGWPLERDLVASLALNLAAGLALVFYLRSARYHYVSAGLLLLGMAVAYGAIVRAHPASYAIAYGVLPVIAAISLLGARLAALSPLVVWVLGVLARSPGRLTFGDDSLQILLLNLLVLAAVALSSRSLTVAVEWAITGWAKVSDALAEARERRAELHRALRALEEATTRIERMNRELIMAHHRAEAERDAKARFAAIVSHELRGPLNLILGFSKMMVLSPERYAVALPAPYRSDLVTVYENSRHLAALVDDVLDLSRIDADRLTLVKAPVDVRAEVIDLSVSAVRPWARRKGLALRVEAPDELPPVTADRVRLSQVLLNLLTNAIRFTEAGEITVRAAADEGRVLLSVRDTGSGIAADDLARVFDEFRQASKPVGGDLGGTGLGLSISRQLVRLHGGDLWVTSVEGQGSEFAFSLPLGAPAAQPAPRALSTGPRRTPDAPPVCLVVHSDPQIVRHLARQLGDYRVVGVPDAERVPAHIEQLHPAGIITGAEDVARVSWQLARANARVPVLGCRMAHRRADYGPVRVLGHLIKPFSAEVLQALMRQVDRGGEVKILLVDDDADAVRLLEGMLRLLPRPYRIAAAYSGLEALARMEEEVPDVALIDLAMPQMRGDELIRRMGERKATRGVPVIIVSASDTAHEEIRIATPIIIRDERALSLDQGAAFIRAALEVFRPDYLPPGDPARPIGPGG